MLGKLTERLFLTEVYARGGISIPDILTASTSLENLANLAGRPGLSGSWRSFRNNHNNEGMGMGGVAGLGRGLAAWRPGGNSEGAAGPGIAVEDGEGEF